MTKDHFKTLNSNDWGDSWDSLAEAPELIPRTNSTQITLRLSATLVARIKRVANAQSIPYHVLVRSWLVDVVRNPEIIQSLSRDPGPYLEQLNIKLDQATLDELKKLGSTSKKPYHRMAREWIQSQTSLAEAKLKINISDVSPPPIRELMVLLLHASNRQGKNVVKGMTRLQKLLFVVEQEISSQSSFYAFNYGPFNEEVNDAAKALEVAGFIKGVKSSSAGPPSFQEMIETVSGRAGPSNDERDVVEFALSDEGHEAAERLRHSGPSYEQLYQMVESVKQEWDTPKLSDLVDRVYETWPKYTEKSVIRKEVELRNHRRSKP